ncbi:hypothetical protein E2562_032273 [Oryza meyeriana var. granulata]|uniref:Uncharacterized protein n=1 Tax=Oryza meyeriana var. granulata TaxID=110450 RepID=A0A6G1F0H9_9ORYZ|nr:hypothetical protein E2562_032273 [Oryza meyeriana var. granulata]
MAASPKKPKRREWGEKGYAEQPRRRFEGEAPTTTYGDKGGSEQPPIRRAPYGGSTPLSMQLQCVRVERHITKTTAWRPIGLSNTGETHVQGRAGMARPAQQAQEEPTMKSRTLVHRARPSAA